MDAVGRCVEIDLTPESTHSLVLSLIPAGSRVLEFGCATGYMSAVMTEQLGCSVTGVEISADAADLAREHCDRVVVGDAEQLDLCELFRDERFDVILFADVLEHLKDPERLLHGVSPLLTADGSIVASIPNVAHGSVRLALLNGEFRYREAGLLDGTHLRFFTRDSVRDLFESTGYVISTWLRRHGDIAAVEIPVLPSQVPPEIWERLKADPEATTYQFVVRAVPAGSAAAIHHLRSEKDALELDVRRLEQRLELQQQEVDALRAQATSFPDEIAQRDAWVAELQHEIERRDAWVTELQHEVERRDAWVTELQHTVEQHASSIAELQHGIERRDGWVADLQGEVERRDTWVASLRQEVERRDGLIDGQQGELARARNQLQQEVRERDARIVQLQQEVAGRDERLQAITASRLWRCAQAYWKVRRRLTGTETGSPSPAPGPE